MGPKHHSDTNDDYKNNNVSDKNNSKINDKNKWINKQWMRIKNKRKLWRK